MRNGKAENRKLETDRHEQTRSQRRLRVCFFIYSFIYSSGNVRPLC
jgi:hypothetical protein